MRLANAHVLDLEAGRFERRDLHVDGTRFARSAKGRTVDLGGAYVLPGFFDCHVHIAMRTELSSSIDVWHNALPGETALYAARAARRTLMCGITTARDVGGWDYHEIAVRNAINAGSLVGSRLFCSGRILTQTCATTPYFPGMYRECDGPAEVRKAAREQLAKGADLIKLMATGAITSAESERADAIQFRRDEISAAVEIAEDNGLHVAAHAHALEGIVNASECGCRSVEHASFGTRAAYEILAANGTWIVPTLCLHQALLSDKAFAALAPEHIRKRYEETEAVHIENISTAYKAGVRIAMGTDIGTPGNHAGENMQELDLMVNAAGMTEIDAIRASTISPATMMGLEKRLGSLDEGKIADAIAVDRDPLEDISALNDVFFVMKDGQVHRNDREFRPEPDGRVITEPVSSPLS